MQVLTIQKKKYLLEQMNANVLQNHLLGLWKPSQSSVNKSGEINQNVTNQIDNSQQYNVAFRITNALTQKKQKKTKKQELYKNLLMNSPTYAYNKCITKFLGFCSAYQPSTYILMRTMDTILL